MATWDDVGRIVGELPETAEASPRNWRVRKKLIAWERPLRKADYAALGTDAPDGDILGARVADEGVTTLRAADAADEAGASQRGQELVEVGLRDALARGD